MADALLRGDASIVNAPFCVFRRGMATSTAIDRGATTGFIHSGAASGNSASPRGAGHTDPRYAGSRASFHRIHTHD